MWTVCSGLTDKSRCNKNKNAEINLRVLFCGFLVGLGKFISPLYR